MPTFLTDSEIEALLNERKPLPDNWQSKLVGRDKFGHKEAKIEVKGDDGNVFLLLTRQNKSNPLDFSIILAFLPNQSNERVILCRYNGKSHRHTNQIEKSQGKPNASFFDFHIHLRTERYQQAGKGPESFAEVTDKYDNFEGAKSALLHKCGFYVVGTGNPGQGELF